MPSTSFPRLVLDTNIWLDWLVFANPEVASIKALVTSGAAEVFIDAHCTNELIRVLAYPRTTTTLDADAQAECLAECRKHARQWINPQAHATQSSEAGARLPICRDADDQKFLELARDCGATYLITRDHDLLLLARRRIRATPFCIVTPGQFTAMLHPA